MGKNDCAVTGGKHIPGCGCAGEPAPSAQALKRTGGGYECCGGRNSHRDDCVNKNIRGPSNVNRQNPDRPVCGYPWVTKGAAHTHVCGLKPHKGNTRHVCEHPNCDDVPPRNTWGKPGPPAVTPPAPPGGGGSGPGGGNCRRCGGNKKIPGPRRTWIKCPVCDGTGKGR